MARRARVRPMPEHGRRLLPLAVIAILAGCIPPVAEPSSFDVPDPTPTSSAAVSAATSSATVAPSTTAAPTPSPTPDPSVLELEATSCDGGVVLDWSPSTDSTFHHYTALRSPNRDIDPDYPPIAPAVDWGDTYATDRFVTTAVDASIIPSETRWFYRVMAYDVENAVIAASPVRGARLGDVDDLGGLEMSTEEGLTRVAWTAYGGFSGCFSAYRILYGTGTVPTAVLTVVSDQATTEFQTSALHSGTGYVLRVEAVRGTTLGSFVAGRSDVASYEVP